MEPIVQPAPRHMFFIVSITLAGLVGFTFFNIWLFREGQKSASTIVSHPYPASNVLGESQTLASPTETVKTGQSFDILAPARSSPTGINACDPSGQCNSYSNPQAAGCPVTFSDARCGNGCADPKTRCRDY